MTTGNTSNSTIDWNSVLQNWLGNARGSQGPSGQPVTPFLYSPFLGVSSNYAGPATNPGQSLFNYGQTNNPSPGETNYGIARSANSFGPPPAPAPAAPPPPGDPGPWLQQTGSWRGGAVKRAPGGSVANQPPPLLGFIAHPSPGRADAVDGQVPNNSYVLPADFVSYVGQGNSLAGGAIIKNWVQRILQGQTGSGLAPDPVQQDSPDMIPVKVSGGEVALPPAFVAAVGGGDFDKGSKALDQIILAARKDHISTLKGLPRPAKGDE